MLLKLSTEPTKTKTGTIATTDELKRQLNIPEHFDDDDTILSDLLDVATEQVESDTNSDIMDTANVLEYTFNKNGNSAQVPTDIYINQAPARSVDKIEIDNGSGYAEVSTADYSVTIEHSRIEIYFKTTQNAVKIRFTFTTGYTDAKRPKKLKQAALLKAADLFDPERAGYTTTALAENKAYNRLIAKHIITYW